MSSAAGVEAEIASVITGLILLFSACSAYIAYKVKRAKSSLEEEKILQEKEKTNDRADSGKGAE